MSNTNKGRVRPDDDSNNNLNNVSSAPNPNSGSSWNEASTSGSRGRRVSSNTDNSRGNRPIIPDTNRINSIQEQGGYSRAPSESPNSSASNISNSVPSNYQPSQWGNINSPAAPTSDFTESEQDTKKKSRKGLVMLIVGGVCLIAAVIGSFLLKAGVDDLDIVDPMLQEGYSQVINEVNNDEDLLPGLEAISSYTPQESEDYVVVPEVTPEVTPDNQLVELEQQPLEEPVVVTPEPEPQIEIGEGGGNWAELRNPTFTDYDDNYGRLDPEVYNTLADAVQSYTGNGPELKIFGSTLFKGQNKEIVESYLVHTDLNREADAQALLGQLQTKYGFDNISSLHYIAHLNDGSDLFATDEGLTFQALVQDGELLDNYYAAWGNSRLADYYLSIFYDSDPIRNVDAWIHNKPLMGYDAPTTINDLLVRADVVFTATAQEGLGDQLQVNLDRAMNDIYTNASFELSRAVPANDKLVRANVGSYEAPNWVYYTYGVDKVLTPQG